MKYIFSETHPRKNSKLHFTAKYIKDINFTVRYSEGVVVCREGVKTTNRRNQFLQFLVLLYAHVLLFHAIGILKGHSGSE